VPRLGQQAGAVTKRRPPTDFEREVLDVLLRELRRAMRRKEQLSILVDPFTLGGGTYIFAATNPAGHTYTIEKGTKTR
jgi:hypothetical protein